MYIEDVKIFSLVNKPLLMSKQNYEALSKKQRKKLCQNGKEMTSVSENGENSIRKSFQFLDP